MRYLWFVFIFIACRNASQKQHPAQKLVVENIDTVKSSSSSVLTEPTVFERAFIKGSTERLKDVTLDLFGVNIGTVRIESGKIVACDPRLIEEYGNPFIQNFPTGEFPVQLGIAKLNGEETPAFARIYFSDEPPVQWKYALLKDETDAPISEEKKYGYVVDNGFGSFMDVNTRRVLDSVPVKDFYSALEKKTNEHRHYIWRYAKYQTGSHDLVCFSAGTGDGHYATYIGYDAKGQPCRLLTDFGIFDWRKK